MIRRPPSSTLDRSSAASDVYKRQTWLRILAGAVLVIGGLVVLVVAGNSLGGVNTTILAVGATLVGVVLLTVPLWMRMIRTLDAERAARILSLIHISEPTRPY